MAEILSDLRLQEVIDQHNLSLSIHSNEEGFPVINVTFPTPTEELSTYDSICDGCGKAAKAVLKDSEEYNLVPGVKIHFKNMFQYEVPDCCLEALDPDAKYQAARDYIDGIVSECSDLLAFCKVDEGVLDNPFSVRSEVSNLMKEILINHDIKMRRKIPPLVSKVRTALTIIE